MFGVRLSWLATIERQFQHIGRPADRSPLRCRKLIDTKQNWEVDRERCVTTPNREYVHRHDLSQPYDKLAPPMEEDITCKHIYKSMKKASRQRVSQHPSCPYSHQSSIIQQSCMSELSTFIRRGVRLQNVARRV